MVGRPVEAITGVLLMACAAASYPAARRRFPMGSGGSGARIASNVRGRIVLLGGLGVVLVLTAAFGH
jgi:hypothetical protein